MHTILNVHSVNTPAIPMPWASELIITTDRLIIIYDSSSHKILLCPRCRRRPQYHSCTILYIKYSFFIVLRHPVFKQNFTGVRLRLHFASVYVTLPQKKANKIYTTSGLAPVCVSRHLCIKFLSRPHFLYICHSLKYSNEPLVYVLN